MPYLEASLIHLRPLAPEEFRPYGWLLGSPIPGNGSIPAFNSADTDFWHQHIFDSGSGGQTEVLWVAYRNTQRAVSNMEVHRLTQQAVVPLTGEIIQIVACSQPDGSLDNGSLSAFRVPVGVGICMRPGCWHTTRVEAPEVQCLMLTRASTTVDLIAHLTGDSSLSESALIVVERKLSPSI